MVYIPLVKAVEVFRQKVFLKHRKDSRLAVFEIAIFQVPMSRDYPDGLKYRAWLSENGKTIFGFDNHKPKGSHLHIGNQEVGYVFRGLKALREDIIAMIKKEDFIYEN